MKDENAELAQDIRDMLRELEISESQQISTLLLALEAEEDDEEEE